VIDGVTVQDLVNHGDDRGFFREIIRITNPAFTGFGQLSHSLVNTGVLKAWHAHVVQFQWTYMVNGVFSVVLYDHRRESKTFGQSAILRTGEGQRPVVYGFPPGVLHGYRCLAGPAHVMYVTSGTYDPADEVRIEKDDPSVRYSW